MAQQRNTEEAVDAAISKLYEEHGFATPAWAREQAVNHETDLVAAYHQLPARSKRRGYFTRRNLGPGSPNL